MKGWTMALRHRIALAAPVAGIVIAGSLGLGGLAGAGTASNDPGTNAPHAGTPVGARAASAPTAAAHKLQYYTVDAAGFVPDGLHNTADDYFDQWDPATLTNTDVDRCFNASVHLPSGAKITTVTVYYTAGSSEMYFDFNRQDLADHTSVDLVSADTPVGSGYTSMVETVSSADNSVDNQDGYGFGVCPDGTTTFSGVTVAYTG